MPSGIHSPCIKEQHAHICILIAFIRLTRKGGGQRLGNPLITIPAGHEKRKQCRAFGERMTQLRDPYLKPIQFLDHPPSPLPKARKQVPVSVAILDQHTTGNNATLLQRPVTRGLLDLGHLLANGKTHSTNALGMLAKLLLLSRLSEHGTWQREGPRARCELRRGRWGQQPVTGGDTATYWISSSSSSRASGPVSMAVFFLRVFFRFLFLKVATGAAASAMLMPGSSR